MKNPYLTKQKDRNPAARPFFNFSPQFKQKTLNIAPLDIATCGPRKDQFNNSLMPAFHWLIVPFLGTICNCDLLMAREQVNAELTGAVCTGHRVSGSKRNSMHFFQWRNASAPLSSSARQAGLGGYVGVTQRGMGSFTLPKHRVRFLLYRDFSFRQEVLGL